jgi:hypothetical protein
VDQDKDQNIVMQDKLHSFQREAFLHYNQYHSMVDNLEVECKTRNVVFKRLPESYISNLYINEPECWKEASYSSSKYM